MKYVSTAIFSMKSTDRCCGMDCRICTGDDYFSRTVGRIIRIATDWRRGSSSSRHEWLAPIGPRRGGCHANHGPPTTCAIVSVRLLWIPRYIGMSSFAPASV